MSIRQSKPATEKYEIDLVTPSSSIATVKPALSPYCRTCPDCPLSNQGDELSGQLEPDYRICIAPGCPLFEFQLFQLIQDSINPNKQI